MLAITDIIPNFNLREGLEQRVRTRTAARHMKADAPMTTPTLKKS